MLDIILLLKPLCQDFVEEDYYVEKNYSAAIIMRLKVVEVK